MKHKLYGGYTFKELGELGPREFARVTGWPLAYTRRVMGYRDQIAEQVAAGKKEFKKLYPRYNETWSLAEDRELGRLMRKALRAGVTERQAYWIVAQKLGRNWGGVEARIRILALVDKYVGIEVTRRMRGTRA